MSLKKFCYFFFVECQTHKTTSTQDICFDMSDRSSENNESCVIDFQKAFEFVQVVMFSHNENMFFSSDIFVHNDIFDRIDVVEFETVFSDRASVSGEIEHVVSVQDHVTAV